MSELDQGVCLDAVSKQKEGSELFLHSGRMMRLRPTKPSFEKVPMKFTHHLSMIPLFTLLVHH